MAILLTTCAVTPSPEVSTGIPIELVGESVIVVHGRVNGVEADIVVDTGSTVAVLSESFAEALGLQATTEKEIEAVGGQVAARMVHGLDFRIGDAFLRSLDGVVVDLFGLSEHMERDCSAIIGLQLFDYYVVEMDLEVQRIAFMLPYEHTYSGTGKTLPIRRAEGGWLVEAQIEGFPLAEFMIDTGSNVPVTLFGSSQSIWSELLADGRASEQGSGYGAAGRTSGEWCTGVVELGGFRLPDVPIVFIPAEVGTQRSSAIGTIGMGLLSRFRVTLDGPRELMHLEETPNTRRPFRSLARSHRVFRQVAVANTTDANVSLGGRPHGPRSK